ncbi:6272_t:CDS:10 [Entrophospora sp. SA101]|nr:6272_t:CDS:10 [Entrophospora sp. SA101]CAJ0905238.1 11449_t:CDS:10 [Entrophospora sp. SA101]CAJ0917403.1 11899_t:CDS:10 [Entrophospora sp. SA101]
MRPLQRTIAVLGDTAVGKSSLTIQFVENHFVDSYYPTIENTFNKVIRYHGQEIAAEIIDTAGQEEHSLFNPTYGVGTDGYILVYSITSKKSFEKLTPEEGKELSIQWNCAWTEASAKHNENITRIFELMIGEIEKLNYPNGEEHSSFIALEYRDGVMMAADNLASYGNLARFKDVERICPIGDYTMIGASGDISDFQYVQHLLNTVMIEEYYTNDSHTLSAPHIYEFLSKVMYNRRSQFNPLWNSFIVGGYHKGEKFLGHTDLLGTTFKATTISTGFGAHLVQPILRNAVEGREDTLTEEEAITAIDNCMKVLYYRDTRSLNKFQRAKITEQGFEITQPYSVATDWKYAEGIRGYGAQVD